MSEDLFKKEFDEKFLKNPENTLSKVQIHPRARPCQNKKCNKLVNNRYLFKGLWLCWDCVRIAIKKRYDKYYEELRKSLAEESKRND